MGLGEARDVEDGMELVYKNSVYLNLFTNPKSTNILFHIANPMLYK
jgi:hypothetical protein